VVFGFAPCSGAAQAPGGARCIPRKVRAAEVPTVLVWATLVLGACFSWSADPPKLVLIIFFQIIH